MAAGRAAKVRPDLRDLSSRSQTSALTSVKKDYTQLAVPFENSRFVNQRWRKASGHEI